MRAFWAILTVFACFSLTIWPSEDRSIGINSHAVEVLGRYLKTVAEELREYARENDGNYPTTAEGLVPLWRNPPRHSYLPPVEQRADGSYDFDKANKGSRSFVYPIPEGFADPYGIPLVYENRNGHPTAAFAGSLIQHSASSKSWFFASPAELANGWWVAVDKNVYLYSIAGYRRWQQAAAAVKSQQYISGAIALAALFCFAMFIRACVRHYRDPTVAAGRSMKTFNFCLGSFLVVIGVVSIPNFRTCYRYTLWHRHKDKQSVAQYVALVEDMRDRGVIPPETCQKLINAAARGPSPAR